MCLLFTVSVCDRKLDWTRAAAAELHSAVDTRVIGKPSIFNGKQERWVAWSFVFRSFCGAVSQGLVEMMTKYEQSIEEIDQNNLTDDEKPWSRQLYYMLVI